MPVATGQQIINALRIVADLMTGTVKRRTYEPSPCVTFSTKLRNILLKLSSVPSPKATTSTDTLFFLSFFASLIMLVSSEPGSVRGEPTKTMMR